MPLPTNRARPSRMAWNSHRSWARSFLRFECTTQCSCLQVNCPLWPQAAPLVADTPFAYTMQAPELAILYHNSGSPANSSPARRPPSIVTGGAAVAAHSIAIAAPGGAYKPSGQAGGLRVRPGAARRQRPSTAAASEKRIATIKRGGRPSRPYAHGAERTAVGLRYKSD